MEVPFDAPQVKNNSDILSSKQSTSFLDYLKSEDGISYENTDEYVHQLLSSERQYEVAGGGNWSEIEAPAWNITSNSTVNNTSLYNFYEAEQFAVLWLLLLSIVIGNTAVIVALRLSKARKSRTNFFIMHLALADLLVGLISVLTDLVWKLTIEWYAGNTGCKLVRFSQILVTYSSTYVLVALSIDRYDAITHPMNFSGSWRRARQLVGAAWLISAVFAAPSLWLFRETEVQGMKQCWISFPEPWHWQLYMVLVALTLFVIPCLLISLCYIVIVHTIWSKGRLMMPHGPVVSDEGSKKNGTTAAAVAAAEEDCRRASSRGLIPKAKVKTVKMTLVIVVVFILCWSPYIVFDLLQVFGLAPNNQALATLMQSLAPLNSAANPVIYCWFSTRLCRNLRAVEPGPDTSDSSNFESSDSDSSSPQISSTQTHRLRLRLLTL